MVINVHTALHKSKINIVHRNFGIIFRTFTFIDEEMFLICINQLSGIMSNMALQSGHPYTKKKKKKKKKKNYYRECPAACYKVSSFMQKPILPRNAS